MAGVTLTVAQALVRFLDNQYMEFDGEQTKFVEGVATIFGHGIVLGLGQALGENPGGLRYIQGKNEQGMAHMATAFAKQSGRRKIIAVASSIGPGAANMVTAAATATVNNLPLLLLPGDAFATRQPDPVLQQIEQPYSAAITTNDAFKPVCKYWDRVSRPEQLMTALLNAMRVLTSPAETGAVCLALPQDVQGESYEWPEEFLARRVHVIPRPRPDAALLARAADVLAAAQKPLVICGGGVRYSGAGQTLAALCEEFAIPLAETQAGKSALPGSHEYNLGGVGVTGNLAANRLAKQADCILAVGTRLSDFTTASKWLFAPGAPVIALNAGELHATKLNALPLVGDAQAGLAELAPLLRAHGYRAAWGGEIAAARAAWNNEMQKLCGYRYGEGFGTLVQAQNPASLADYVRDVQGTLTQTEAICAIRRGIAANAVIVGASGSLPGDLQRMWATDAPGSYHMEYGYSCMGYEIAGALGAKLAQPGREVYAMVGDGSFYMLHSELLTALQDGVKIDILLFDNASFGCINNLQMGNGGESLGTEFRYRGEGGGHTGPFMNTDFAAIMRAYGGTAYTARTLPQLEAALAECRSAPGSTLIDIKVLPKTMTEGYESWWHVGVAGTSQSTAVQAAYQEKETQRKKARPY